MTISRLFLASAVALAATTASAAPEPVQPSVEQIVDSAKAGAAKVRIDSISDIVIISTRPDSGEITARIIESPSGNDADSNDRDISEMTYRMARLASRERALDSVLEMVSILAAFMFIPLLCIMLPLVIIYRYRRRMMLDKYKVVEQAIERNYPLPESFFATGRPLAESISKSGRSLAGRFGAVSAADSAQLNKALTLTAVGVGLLIFGLATGSPEFAGLMSIPLFIGVARLVSYFLQRPQGSQADTVTPPPAPNGSVSPEIPPVPPCYNPEQQESGNNADQA